MPDLHTFSDTVSKWLVCQANTREKQTVVTYGLEILFGSVIKIFTLVFAGILLDILKPLIVTAVTFCSYRLVAGGVHCSAYLRCLLLGTGMFIVAAWISVCLSHYPYLISYLVLFTCLFSFLTALKYAPMDSPAKPINDQKERRRRRYWALVFVLAWGVVILFTGLSRDVVSASCLGLLCQTLTLHPLGVKSINLLDELLSKNLSNRKEV